MPQYSPEWWAVRLGKVTASAVAKVFSKGKGGDEAIGRRDYRIALALERLTGRSTGEDGFVSADMRRGTEKEPDARLAYEAATGSLVMEVGFCEHDTLAAGCSPDGLTDSGLTVIDFKCPKSSTHLDTLRSRAVPSEYVPQLTMALWITGATCAHFVSFDDRFPVESQLVIVPHARDEKAIEALELGVRVFLSEIDREVESIRALCPVVA